MIIDITTLNRSIKHLSVIISLFCCSPCHESCDFLLRSDVHFAVLHIARDGDFVDQEDPKCRRGSEIDPNADGYCQK